MKKILLIGFLSLFVLGFSQIGGGMSSASNKWTFGGSAGLFFGSNDAFGVSVSPRVGYKITEDFEMGVMGGYTYEGNKYYQNNMLSVGPFANYYIARNFFLSANFQEYFMNYKDKYYNTTYKHDEAALYLGAGYMQRVGNGAYLQLGAAYNVLYNKDKSYFSGGFVPSVGVVFGL